ncbi:TetR/AcrR family transcriptional regulator [Kutzneria kofuensis]|uniref:AcrR family transcriptional regulator n=1 Tax=Kutzneria kofuensis TaxID=103725 RepID=A0A7W9KC54_9PSEU|nr:TetR/AcrR family transcriptional regulator [Kutzneria kofuensis]MBB5889473.1 AcrR family transcriptional regulator [Kutzneria kofuensis]
MTEAPADTGARSRTRRAILDAAATVLARHRGATLADIAEAAEVGRTTLHRYFPDREALLTAVVEDSWRTIEDATRDAAIDDGPPAEAMRRLVSAMVDAGDRLLFLFGDPRRSDDHPVPPQDPILDLIRRGQADGAFDPGVSAEWIRTVVWGLVYAGCEAAGDGLLPRHGVTETVIRTLQNGIGPHAGR